MSKALEFERVAMNRENIIITTKTRVITDHHCHQGKARLSLLASTARTANTPTTATTTTPEDIATNEETDRTT